MQILGEIKEIYWILLDIYNEDKANEILVMQENVLSFLDIISETNVAKSW